MISFIKREEGETSGKRREIFRMKEGERKIINQCSLYNFSSFHPLWIPHRGISTVDIFFPISIRVEN